MCDGSDFKNSPSWHIKWALGNFVFHVKRLPPYLWAVTVIYFRSFSQKSCFCPVSGTSGLTCVSSQSMVRIHRLYFHTHRPTFLECFSQIGLSGITTEFFPQSQVDTRSLGSLKCVMEWAGQEIPWESYPSSYHQCNQLYE